MPPIDPNALMKEMASADAELDIRALLLGIMNAFGGLSVFAVEVVENLRASELGSSSRTQGYNNIMGALQKFGHVDSVDDGEDAESIEAQLRLLASETKTVSDGDG